jgi:hypothetical protein
MTRFPHLLPADCVLWQKFIDLHGGAYSQFIYDVRVGEGTDPGPEFPDNIRYDAITLSQRRIDVIGFQANEITLFEVTTSAGLTALGQCMAYPKLYVTTYTPDRPVKMHLVTYQFQSDIQPLYDHHAIEYTVIEGAPPPQPREEQS